MSSNDFPLSHIVEFLNMVVPFDSLNTNEMADLASHMEIAYYPPNETIIKQGDPPPCYLYIIHTGSVRATTFDDCEEKVIVDIRGRGDVFGATSILEGKIVLFDITSIENLIVLLLPAEEFQKLVDKKSLFKQCFGFSLAQYISAMRQSANKQLSKLTVTNSLNIDIYIMSKQVSDLMTTKVVCCTPDNSIREAAKLMTLNNISSIVITDKTNQLLGILTDSDLRSRALVEGYRMDSPVLKVMSSPVREINPKAFAFDALLEMSRHGISHLVVTEHNKIMGIVSEHDFQMAFGNSPIGLIGDIEKSRSVGDMVDLHKKIDHVLGTLLRQGCPIERILNIITELNDRTTLRLLNITELEMEKEGFGLSPTCYCWMALGSEGRREQTLRTDQDNALVYADTIEEEGKRTRKWFQIFSEKMVDNLVRCGFPRCPGGIMASNPRWCCPEAHWRKIFTDWIVGKDGLALRMSTIFFDFRAIYDGANFESTLRNIRDVNIKANPLFLRLLAKISLENQTPLGFLRQFVLEKSGEHRNELDLKWKGLMPIIESARVLALDIGIDTNNSIERLDASNKAGLINYELYSDVKESYNFINSLRIYLHLDARKQDKELSNFVDPRSLNNFQRKMLKECFIVINKLQDLIELRYKTSYFDF